MGKKVYEVERGGVVYEVEADSAEQAMTVAMAFSESSAPAQQPMNRGSAYAAAHTPEGLETNRQLAPSVGSGIVEGIQRTVAGGKQLAGAVSDYFTRLDRAGRGANEKFTAQEMLRAATATADAAEKNRLMGLRELTAGATQAAALTAGPEMGLPRATTVIGAMAKNFLSGGIGGAATFAPSPGPELAPDGVTLVDYDSSKMDDAVGGAVTSTLWGLVPSLPPAIKNVVGKGLARIAGEGRTAARVANAQQALPNTPFSLAQRTGVPELRYLEHRAYDYDQVNFFADQTDAFIADAAKALRQPIAPNQTLGGDAAIFKQAMSDNIGSIKKNASRAYEYGMSKAAITATSNPQPLQGVKVPAAQFRSQLEAIVQDSNSPLATAGEELLKESFVKQAMFASQGGTMDPAQLANLLKGLTRLQKSDDKIKAAVGSRLREALDGDLDILEQQGPMLTDDVTKMILQTRAEYRRAMQAANALSESAVYKLVDGADTPEGIVNAVKSYGPQKQEAIRTFLEQNNPAMLRSLKQEVVNDAVRSAGVIREAADAQQDLAKLQATLFDGDQFRTSGLWSPQELKKVNSIADGLRVIQNNRPLVGSAGTPVGPEDVAINLVSRSAPFMARFITRALTGAQASRFFTDPTIYAIMTKINRSTTGSASNLAGRAALLSYLQEEYAEPEPQPAQQ